MIAKRDALRSAKFEKSEKRKRSGIYPFNATQHSHGHRRFRTPPRLLVALLRLLHNSTSGIPLVFARSRIQRPARFCRRAKVLLMVNNQQTVDEAGGRENVNGRRKRSACTGQSTREYPRPGYWICGFAKGASGMSDTSDRITSQLYIGENRFET